MKQKETPESKLDYIKASCISSKVDSVKSWYNIMVYSNHGMSLRLIQQ